MTREIQWSRPARLELNAYLSQLAEVNRMAGLRAAADIELRVGRLSIHPMLGRVADWPGLRALSLARWRKIAIYQVFDDRIAIVAFLDARQDRSVLTIEAETD